MHSTTSRGVPGGLCCGRRRWSAARSATSVPFKAFAREMIPAVILSNSRAELRV
ncbi:hypothetical protein PV350_12335 [Streptomyces sp. PA03-6a]|nr:hypothetical protein [Streptomyces sp. PA03-6a]